MPDLVFKQSRRDLTWQSEIVYSPGKHWFLGSYDRVGGVNYYWCRSRIGIEYVG